MKKKDFKDLKEKSTADLNKILETKKLEYFKSKAVSVRGGDKNLKTGRNLRRDIAKISTLISEKRILDKLSGEKNTDEKGKK